MWLMCTSAHVICRPTAPFSYWQLTCGLDFFLLKAGWILSKPVSSAPISRDFHSTSHSFHHPLIAISLSSSKMPEPQSSILDEPIMGFCWFHSPTHAHLTTSVTQHNTSPETATSHNLSTSLFLNTISLTAHYDYERNNSSPILHRNPAYSARVGCDYKPCPTTAIASEASPTCLTLSTEGQLPQNIAEYSQCFQRNPQAFRKSAEQAGGQ